MHDLATRARLTQSRGAPVLLLVACLMLTPSALGVEITGSSSAALRVPFPAIGVSAVPGAPILNSVAVSTKPLALLQAQGNRGRHLSVSATSVSFGSVTLAMASRHSVTLTSIGTVPVMIDAATLTGDAFSVTGARLPVTLNPTRSVTLEVQFKPIAIGAAAGRLTIKSNSSSGNPASVALRGTGTAAVPHQVDLNWNAPGNSSDQVAGYNIYRSTGSGPYLLISASPDVQTTYVDSTVVGGATYDYFVRSIDYSGVESDPSNQIAVAVP